MQIAFLDCETTGLDLENEEITEIAVVLQTFGHPKHSAIFHSYLYAPTEKFDNVSEMITDLTKIDTLFLRAHGKDPSETIHRLNRFLEPADVIVAHNGKGFDKPMLENFAKRWGCELVEKDWIDTSSDIPWPYRYTNQSWIAMEQGFLNPFPHDALSDTFTLRKIFNNQIPNSQALHELVEYSKLPDITAIAQVTFSTNKLAKERGYRWNPSQKVWWKKMKEFELKQEREEAGFAIRTEETTGQ